MGLVRTLTHNHSPTHADMHVRLGKVAALKLATERTHIRFMFRTMMVIATAIVRNMWGCRPSYSKRSCEILDASRPLCIFITQFATSQEGVVRQLLPSFSSRPDRKTVLRSTGLILGYCWSPNINNEMLQAEQHSVSCTMLAMALSKASAVPTPAYTSTHMLLRNCQYMLGFKEHSPTCQIRGTRLLAQSGAKGN